MSLNQSPLACSTRRAFPTRDFSEVAVNNANLFLPGMIVIDTANPAADARNISTKTLTGARARAHGKMQYVQGIGQNGTLIQIGGSSKAIEEVNELEFVDLIALDEVGVFDIASLNDKSTPDGTWYVQNTSGPAVPSPRVDFCLVAASAPDSSSHNIYMYGGRDLNSYFDEIWVLSLPSFTWTLVYSGESPRFAHTCHLAGQRTMLTVGGVNSINQMQGRPGVSALPCDWEVKGIGVLDISTMIWGSVYNADAPAYMVPEKVVSVIGGSGMGNSRIKGPAAGFAKDGLAELFGVKVKPSSEASHRTAKIAGSVCGVIGCALIVGLIWLVQKQLRKMRASHEQPIYELDATKTPGRENGTLSVEGSDSH